MPKIAVNLTPEQVEALSKIFPDIPLEDALLALVDGAISSGKAPRAEDRGLKSIVDAINAYTGKIDEIGRRLSHIIEILEDLSIRLQNLEEQTRGAPLKPQQVVVEEKKEARKSAIDILRDQKIMFESDIVSKIKNRDAFFEKLRRSGAVVIELAKERVAVDPDFFNSFKEKVERVTSSSEEVLQRDLGKHELRLLKALVGSGLAYFDNTKKRWVIEVDEAL